MPSIDIGGARVAYAEAGSGEAVLLLHSSASSSAQWRSLTERLQASCRVLAPDLYGYGETDPWPGPGPATLAEEAALADAVLATCNGPIHLVGHSYGGAVALRLAIEQPDRLRSLVLIEPVAFHLLRGAPTNAIEHALFLEIAEVAAAVSLAASGDCTDGMARFFDYWNGEGAWLRASPELRLALACLAPKVALDFRATMTEPTPLAAYRRIAVPALILSGAESPRPTRRICELLAEALPQARLRTIEGAGHMLPLTHREAVNAAIAEHLFHGVADRRRPAA